MRIRAMLRRLFRPFLSSPHPELEQEVEAARQDHEEATQQLRSVIRDVTGEVSEAEVSEVLEMANGDLIGPG